jgi:hypothetical protein
MSPTSGHRPSPAARRAAPARLRAALTAVAPALLAAAAAPVASAPLRAQAVLGIGDDALVLPRGVFRLRVIGQQGRFDERFGVNSATGRRPSERESILADLNIPSIGVLQFPNLAPVQAGLRSLTGITDYQLSLGTTTATGDVRINAGSLVTELGLTRRLSLGVVVPYVDTRNNVNLRVNPGGEGNVGFNPGVAGGVSAARAQNTALVTQLFTAARTLEGAVGLPAGGCATSALAQCQLVNGTRQFAGGVGGIYGADAAPALGFPGAAGSPFVPLGTSQAQQAIAARVAGLRQAYGPLGAGITAAAPFAAPTNLGFADAQRILTESAFGVSAQPVGTTARRSLGDIEVAAKYSLINTFGHADPNARLDPKGVNLRTAITGVARIGTGNAEDPRNFLDVPTGTGANAVGVRSATDVLLGRYFWTSLSLRYTAQLPDDQLVRVTDAPERVLAPAYRQQTVRRDLGDFFELEATPRVVLTDWLLVAGQYYFRDKAEDRFKGSFVIPASVTGFADIPLDARTLNQETRAVERRFGGGVSLSSVKAFARGRARLPGELTYTFQQTNNGFGGAVPRLTLHQVQIRLYARLFGQ